MNVYWILRCRAFELKLRKFEWYDLKNADKFMSKQHVPKVQNIQVLLFDENVKHVSDDSLMKITCNNDMKTRNPNL